MQESDSLFEGQSEGSQQNNNADKDNVISRNPVLLIHFPEEGFWQGIASSHAIEQTRCADLCPHTRSEIGHQESQADDAKQLRPGSRCGEDIRLILIWKQLRSAPHHLRYL